MNFLDRPLPNATAGVMRSMVRLSQAAAQARDAMARFVGLFGMPAVRLESLPRYWRRRFEWRRRLANRRPR